MAGAVSPAGVKALGVVACEQSAGQHHEQLLLSECTGAMLCKVYIGYQERGCCLQMTCVQKTDQSNTFE
jgi:hypothetical protein